MIQFRKTHRLRIARHPTPRAPFWSRATVSPYYPASDSHIQLDLDRLVARSAPGMVDVCIDPSDQLARDRDHLLPPIVIDASTAAEPIYRKGRAAAEFCASASIPHILLISAAGETPGPVPQGSSIAILAWPPDRRALETLAEGVSRISECWGIVVPVMFPITTDLGRLTAIADLAAAHDAAFLTGVSIDAEPEARHRLATSIDDLGEDDYSMLFHGDIDTVHLATERHVAALAHERGMSDFVIPPGFDEPTNWNAAIVLGITGSRLIGLQRDMELAWEMLKASATVAALPKSLSAIADQADLSIVEGLGEEVIDCIEEWLETRSASFSRSVDAEWRLRRDVTI